MADKEPRDTEPDIPSDVIEFLVRLKDALLSKDVDNLNRMYESELTRLTELHYTAQHHNHRNGPRVHQANWPQTKYVKKHLGHNQVELIYQLHQYRSQYTERNVSAMVRKLSWDSFGYAFNTLVQDNLAIDLPNGWIWDIVDEFIYQLSTHRIKRLRPDQAQTLSPQVWNVAEAIVRLETVVEKSGIKALLAEVETGKKAPADVLADGPNHIRTILGYSALVGIVKLRVLLGDYHGALEAADPLGVRSFGPTISQKIAPLHASLYNHIGFAYMMLRRYADAMATLQQALVVKASLRKFLDNQQAQVVTLLLVCSILGDMPLHDYTALVPERLRTQDDDVTLLNQGDLERFRDVFVKACPKFITAADATSGGATETGQEAKELQLRVFLRTVRQQQEVLKLRGYLTAYSTLTSAKVGSLLNTGTTKTPVEAHLVCMKRNSRQRVRNAGSRLIDGELKRTSIVDFTAQDGNITVQTHLEQPTIAASFYDRLHNLKLKSVPKQ